MLTLASCPYCAMQVPSDGAFCDTCGRQFAACPTCNTLTRAGERCTADGAQTALRPSLATAKAGATVPLTVAPAVAAPTVAPPPPRRTAAVTPSVPSAQQTATSPGAPPVTPPVVAPVTVAPVSVAPPSSPQHAAMGTTVQSLSRTLRLIITSGESLPPLDVEHDTVVGRADGPFAMLLDPFHNKGLSRRHCQFRRTATGGWVIVDLAGRNSTFVSSDGRFGAAVAHNASAPIDPAAAQLRLGDLQFRVEGIP